MDSRKQTIRVLNYKIEPKRAIDNLQNHYVHLLSSALNACAWVTRRKYDLQRAPLPQYRKVHIQVIQPNLL